MESSCPREDFEKVSDRLEGTIGMFLRRE